MAFHNVIFDLDGTLLDSVDGLEHAVQAAVRAVLPDRVCPPVADHVGPPIRKILVALLGDLEEPVLAELERQFRAIYDNHSWQYTRPYPGAVAVLRQLQEHGLRCFAATNKPSRPTQSILAHLKMLSYFDDVVSPDTCRPSFRSKEQTVAHILGTHHLNEAECVVVGDSTDDRIAAEANGLAFAAATYGYGRPVSSELESPYIVLDRLADLPRRLGLPCTRKHPSEGCLRRPRGVIAPIPSYSVSISLQGRNEIL
jgi:phosphoglycolate phosphatase